MANKVASAPSPLSCIICTGKLVDLDIQDLFGSTSRGDALYPFSLCRCKVCGHVQKNVSENYQKIMHSVYS